MTVADEQQRRTVAVLAYHKVADPPAGSDSWFYVNEHVFVQHLQYLRDAGWQPLDLTTLVRGVTSPALLPRKGVVITFDDGYKSNVTVAAPHLLRAGFPATVFVATDMIGRLNLFDEGVEPPEPMCDWNDLFALTAAGIAVQSHGRSHTRFSALPLPEIERELRESRNVLEDTLQRPVDAISYPYGDAGTDRAATRALLARTGYRAACLYAEDRPNHVPGTDPFFLARFAIGSDTNLPALLEG